MRFEQTLVQLAVFGNGSVIERLWRLSVGHHHAAEEKRHGGYKDKYRFTHAHVRPPSRAVHVHTTSTKRRTSTNYVLHCATWRWVNENGTGSRGCGSRRRISQQPRVTRSTCD